ncbi:MAG: Gfo/Idh/MocA family protein, partial [Ginsengibacter sp.]
VLNIGVIGAGGFADFAVKSFLKIKGVDIIAVTDLNASAARKMANETNAMVYNDINALLQNEKINLIYIATPPFLHYQQSKLALLAGKHVICEKPAALKLAEAEELAEIAISNQLLYVVNLMQRYNALYKAVQKIIEEKILGNFLHGFFENYASDETLNAGHWFWDQTKSGGIFIEHGVHFFDMFSGWLGKGEVVNAFQIRRPGFSDKIKDRVGASVMYEDGIVNFYHGFDQPKILDRQEMRLLFEHGEITLYEWIPVKIKLHGLLKDAQLNHLKEIMGECSIKSHNKMHTGNNNATGRSIKINFDNEVTIECGDIADKQTRYQQLLINMLTDQWAWIQDRKHKRTINENNAVESLRIAEDATNISKIF